MSTGKHHATVLGGISWVYYGIYIWYLCYLEEVAHLRSDIYGVKWYLVFGNTVCTVTSTHQGILYCVAFLYLPSICRGMLSSVTAVSSLQS